MTTIISGSTTGYAPQAKDEFILQAGTTLSNHNLTAFGASGAAFAGLLLAISGTVEDAGYGVSLINGAVTGSVVHVKESGSVSAKYAAIKLEGDGGAIVNDGFVGGEVWGINIKGSQSSVVNHGDVAGATAVVFEGDGSSLVNHGTITSGGACVSVSVNADEAFSLVNHGTMTSTNYCVVAGDGEIKIVNRGTMEGAVLFGAGDDVFRNKGGNVNGKIYGDNGDDTFIIDRKSIKIVEWDGEGNDTIRSSASFTLSENVETGILTGKKNLSLTGTDMDDRLLGNKGDNRIAGGAGADRITAGKGDDLLMGGGKGLGMDGAADVFVFTTHSGRDRIIGFETGIDGIDLSGYAGFDSFADLRGRIHQAGDDVVISLRGGDDITLIDMLKADIGKDDFAF